MKSKSADAWLLTGGLHGMLSQVNGLADALALNSKHYVTRLNKPWAWLPSFMVPAIESVFEARLPESPPKIIISSGRHAAIASRVLKKKYGDQVFTIHIQNPLMNTALFDCVIAPEHDDMGEPVIATLGALHNLDRRTLEASHDQTDILESGHNQVAVILGGPTKSFAWSVESMAQAVTSLLQAANDNGSQLVVIPSNRTPSIILEMLAAKLSKPHVVMSKVERSSYLAALNGAKHIVVTCDSASMLSEACFTGKPLYCLEFTPRRKNERLAKLHQSLYARGIARPWEGRFDVWQYTPLDEANRVAKIVKEKFPHVFL